MQGRVSFDTRLRFEAVQQEGAVLDAKALTWRARLGYATQAHDGWQVMVEAEHVTALVNDYFDGIPPNSRGYPAVSDPAVTEVNQAWLAYTWKESTTWKLGRQRLVLDNARFVGDVGWRQDMQTFDAVSVRSTAWAPWTVTYAWLHGINRVLGQAADFDSRSHLLHLSRSLAPGINVSTYGYWWDFTNFAAGSSATHGMSLHGRRPWGHAWHGLYRLELARQRDHGNQPVAYRAAYHHVILGAERAGYAISVGEEFLGASRGQGFRTPLGTVHAFNGWSDFALPVGNAFPLGLTNRYLRVDTALPAALQLVGVYHDYTTMRGGRIGREVDLQVSRRWGRNLTVLAKLADFSAAPGWRDVRKVWGQVEWGW